MTTTLVSYVVPGGRMEAYFPVPEQKFKGIVHTEFMDGSCSVFDPSACDHQLSGAARELGYGDRDDLFGIHHEITHNFVAAALSWPCSTIIWQSAHGGKRPPDWKKGEWPFTGWDEEHIVNKLLLQLQTGEEDDHGILRDIWGDRLSLLLGHLNSWVRPWIQPPFGDMPLPVNPDRVCHPMNTPDDEDWRDTFIQREVEIANMRIVRKMNREHRNAQRSTSFAPKRYANRTYSRR